MHISYIITKEIFFFLKFQHLLQPDCSRRSCRRIRCSRRWDSRRFEHLPGGNCCQLWPIPINTLYRVHWRGAEGEKRKTPLSLRSLCVGSHSLWKSKIDDIRKRLRLVWRAKKSRVEPADRKINSLFSSNYFFSANSIQRRPVRIYARSREWWSLGYLYGGELLVEYP